MMATSPAKGDRVRVEPVAHLGGPLVSVRLVDYAGVVATVSLGGESSHGGGEKVAKRALRAVRKRLKDSDHLMTVARVSNNYVDLEWRA